MATIPVRQHDAPDTQSADDMRKLGPVGMLLGAVIAILAIMTIVYAPKMWGIERYGSDVVGNSATGHAGNEKGNPTVDHD
jgi:hypothetical protein